MMRPLMRKTAQTEVERAQKLMGPINEIARLGDQGKLRNFSEQWIAEQLQLADVKLQLDSTDAAPRIAAAGHGGATETIEIKRGGQHFGTLGASSLCAMNLGGTYEAL